MKVISVKLLVLLSLIGCHTIKNEKKHSNYNIYKLESLKQVIKHSIKDAQIKLDFALYKFKDTIKAQKNINKLIPLEDLKRYSIGVSQDLFKIITKVKKNGTEENIKQLMLKENPENLTNKLIGKLEKYYQEYQKKNTQFLSNTTSWTRRYMQLLPKEKRKNPPSFSDFYFKYATKEEVLVTLNMLRLAILQEALEIQQKIINEK